MNRRSFLKSIAAYGGAVALEGCAGRHFRPAASSAPTPFLKLPRVDVSPDREIRTVVGLRPFRPSGFVVRAEKLADKLLVHNYGHGGAGVTLSWGTGEMAARLAHEGGAKNVAVIGSGAVGLSTGRLLQERGHDVAIYTKDLPPNTTSNIAGALWFPTTVYDHEVASPEFKRQFSDAAHSAHKRFQTMVGERYGIRWMPNYFMSNDAFSETGLRGVNGPIRDIMPELRDLNANENPFPYAHVRSYQSMLINPHIYLPALMNDFRAAGGMVKVRDFQSPQELASLSESVVINCTGLGAKALFGDAELTPIKGQLTFLLPQPEIDYITLSGDLYMFPRTDGILLGGTHERGNWSLDPDLEAKQHILKEHASMFAQMRS